MMILMRSHKGDTIVEVLIAIVILAAGIGTAFAISGRAKNATQDNHERYQAQLHANKQAEILRSKYYSYTALKARSSFAADITSPGDGCFDSSSAWKSYSSSSCQGVDSLYNIRISRISTSNAGTVGSMASLTYLIEVTWDKLGGGAGRVGLYYGL